MSERIQRRRSTNAARTDDVEATLAPQQAPVDLDALLDEIDTVLESDAESYVKGFVQKGGQ